MRPGTVTVFILALIAVNVFCACSHTGGGAVQYSVMPENGPYTIAGLPQRPFELAAGYADGTLVPIYYAGTRGFVIKPNGPVHPERRWVWVAPIWPVVFSTYQGDMRFRYYVEPLLARGYHVVGIDIGVSCGSPAGVEIHHKFYDLLMREFKLNPRAMLIGASNGGLIQYAWAFRHPQRVDRIFGIFPVTDMRTWPGLDRVESMTPEGLAYHLTVDELDARLAEFNPIDNVEPLARAGVKIFHVHGDQDHAVPIGPNSLEFAKRYRALGGRNEIDAVEGGGHSDTPEFYACKRGLEFLAE